MTSRLDEASDLKPRDLAQFGVARARDIAFDAVQALWRLRAAEGMKQIDLARAVGRDPAWLSKALRGPGNWRLQTLGELVEGLRGELEITVHPREHAPSRRQNYSAYDRSASPKTENSFSPTGLVPTGSIGDVNIKPSQSSLDTPLQEKLRSTQLTG